MTQNKIEQLIAELCPNGVVFFRIDEVCNISRGRVMSKDYLQANAGEYPVYSSQTAEEWVFGRINTYDYAGEYVTWTTDGANAGSIFYRNGKFSITNVCGLLSPLNWKLNSKYLTYILQIHAKSYVNAGMGNPKLMSNVMGWIKIPVPPLPIQEEIVKILDTFTDLEANLEAELEARKKQYEYYRDELLSFEEDEVELKEILDLTNDRFWIMPATPNFVADWEIRYITSKNIRGGHINFADVKNISMESYLEISKNRPIIKDDILISMIGTIGEVGLVKESDGEFYGQNMYLIRLNQEMISPSYFLHFFDSKKMKNYFSGIKNNSGQGYLKAGQIDSIKIPIPYKDGKPDLQKQRELVSILDKLDALVNSNSIGLPAELSARRKQYEYYRNKLLTFTPLEK